MNEMIKKETMTSLEIAEVTGKQHSNVMRDIRVMVDNVKGQFISELAKDYHRGDRNQYKYLSDNTQNVLLDFCFSKNSDSRYSIEESTYTDTQGKTRSMYVLNKKACYLLASGYDVVLRAKIIDRWEELEIKEQQGLSSDSFDRKLKAASWVADFLNMSAVSKLILAKAVTSEFNLPLPEYVPSEGVVHSADYLLKKHNVGKSSIAFNKELVKLGYLREEQRPKKNGKLSKFKVIADKGLAFGRNDINEKNTNETQPRWYDDKFEELLALVGLNKQQSLELK